MTATHDWYDFVFTVGKGLFGVYGIGKTVSESVKWAARQKRERESSHKRIRELELQLEAAGRSLEVMDGKRRESDAAKDRAQAAYKKWTARDRMVQAEREDYDREQGLTDERS